jgi:hypothetical protein
MFDNTQATAHPPKPRHIPPPANLILPPNGFTQAENKNEALPFQAII